MIGKNPSGFSNHWKNGLFGGGGEDAFGGDGDGVEVDADGVVDGVADGGGDADEGVFTDAAGAEGPDFAGVFDGDDGLLVGGLAEGGEAVFAEDPVDFYTLVEEALKRSKVKYRDPEIMLYMIFELIGSAGYSSIVDSTPVPVTELKPHLLNTVKGIMKMYEAEA